MIQLITYSLLDHATLFDIDFLGNPSLRGKPSCCANFRLIMSISYIEGLLFRGVNIKIIIL